ncbi:MAG: hypothetical protein ABI691_04350 [Ginsengibacter sp.]
MRVLLIIVSLMILAIACSPGKKTTAINKTPANKTMPVCLQTLITTMASETNGSPQSVTKYNYKNQDVYYMVSPCCDKYNIVYDSNCNVLGYPDGGYTGKGDGKMMNFKSEASDEELIWSKDSEVKKPD